MRFTPLLIVPVALFSLIAMAPTSAHAGDGPVLTVTGTGIEPAESTDPEVVVAVTVAAGDPLEYCWTATAGRFASPVATSRWGWNVVDPNDPDDPGWSTDETPYDGGQRCTETRSFQQGSPSLVVQVTDQSSVVSRVVILFQVVQGVAIERSSWGTLKARF